MTLANPRPTTGKFVSVTELADLVRKAANGASNRRIAEKVGVSPETINRIMRGQGDPDVDTLDKIAAAYSVSVQRLRDAAGLPRGESGPYTPPVEANLLTGPQRNALDQLIRAFVDPRGANSEQSVVDSSEAPRTPGKARKEQKTLDEVKGSMALGPPGSSPVNRGKNRDKLGDITDGEVG